jgi:hypothetical protein
MGIRLSKSRTLFRFTSRLSAGLCLLPLTSSAQQARPAAIAAIDTLDAAITGVIVDSYDSRNPFYSSYGRYDPNHVRDSGNILCNGNFSNSILLGDANVATGPSGGAVLGASGGIGSHAWQASHPGEVGRLCVRSSGLNRSY